MQIQPQAAIALQRLAAGQAFGQQRFGQGAAHGQQFGQARFTGTVGAQCAVGGALLQRGGAGRGLGGGTLAGQQAPENVELRAQAALGRQATGQRGVGIGQGLVGLGLAVHRAQGHGQTDACDALAAPSLTGGEHAHGGVGPALQIGTAGLAQGQGFLGLGQQVFVAVLYVAQAQLGR